MQKSVVEAFPNAPVSIAVVWIDMMFLDGAWAAKRSAKIFSNDLRIRHFHDPEQRVGMALSRQLGWSDCAWDIYLFYPKGAEWRGRMPKPATYIHQLGRHAEDGGFYSGEDLVSELRRRMAATVAPASPGTRSAPKPRPRPR